MKGVKRVGWTESIPVDYLATGRNNRWRCHGESFWNEWCRSIFWTVGRSGEWNDFGSRSSGRSPIDGVFLNWWNISTVCTSECCELVVMKWMQVGRVWSALQLCFWVRDDRTERLAANSRKWPEERATPDGTSCCCGRFRPNASSYRVALKRCLIEYSKSYKTV